MSGWIDCNEWMHGTILCDVLGTPLPPKKKYFSCINIDRIIIQSLQVEIFT